MSVNTDVDLIQYLKSWNNVKLQC